MSMSRSLKGRSVRYSAMAVPGALAASMKSLTEVGRQDFRNFLWSVRREVLCSPANIEGVMAGTVSGVDGVKKKADDVEESEK